MGDSLGEVSEMGPRSGWVLRVGGSFWAERLQPPRFGLGPVSISLPDAAGPMISNTSKLLRGPDSIEWVSQRGHVCWRAGGRDRPASHAETGWIDADKACEDCRSVGGSTSRRGEARGSGRERHLAMDDACY